MSVAANQIITRAEGCLGNYPVAASTHLYQGTLGFVTPAGYLSDTTGTGSNRFGGVIRAERDNSAGSAGDLNVDVWNDGVFPLPGTGFVQADVGKEVYATDNYTVTTAYSAGAVRIGTCRAYVSTTVINVEIDTDLDGSMVYAEVAASTAISNTTTQTAFDKSYSFPASSLRPGDIVRVKLQGIATATNSTDTLNVALQVAGADVLTTGALDVANNDIFEIVADIVVRTIGASGTYVACGWTNIGTAGTATTRAGYKASTTIDTTAAVSIAAAATWSNASASNSCRLDILNVELIRRA